MTSAIQDLLPDLIATGAQGIIANADRLGLKWNMQLATVREGADPLAIRAKFDGDSEPINMISTIGTLAIDARVFVIVVPPSGNYIIGGPQSPLGNEEQYWSDAAAIQTTSSTSFSDLTNVVVPFTKRGLGRLKIEMTGTFFTTSATIGAGFGVEINGTDYFITGVWHNTSANAHITFAGTRLISNIPLGSHQIQGRWRASTAGAGPSRNGSDFTSLTVSELAT